MDKEVFTELLTDKQVARLFNCTVFALRRWRREGRGPKFVRVQRMVRYRERDIEEFIKRRIINPADKREVL